MEWSHSQGLKHRCACNGPNSEFWVMCRVEGNSGLGPGLVHSGSFFCVFVPHFLSHCVAAAIL